MKYKTIIKLSEIQNIYKEHCEEYEIEFSEEKFEQFLKFLETDFYDWIEGNLKYFEE